MFSIDLASGRMPAIDWATATIGPTTATGAIGRTESLPIGLRLEAATTGTIMPASTETGTPTSIVTGIRISTAGPGSEAGHGPGPGTTTTIVGTAIGIMATGIIGA